MKNENELFNEHDVLHDLKHYLPAQAPLKDFIHHNTLHAFQKMKFEKALLHAAEIFGYKVTLSLNEFRGLYRNGKIAPKILDHVIKRRKGNENLETWKENVLNKKYEYELPHRIGRVRNVWRSSFHIDMDALVHPVLFRIICSYLDQGISIWNFPVHTKGLLSSLRELERNTFTSFFRTERAKQLLLSGNCGIEHLLNILVDDPILYKHYLFDQQFAHQGWSGMVSTIEDQPQTLLDERKITLHDLIVLELLLEIDALDHKFGTTWAPLKNKLDIYPDELFVEVKEKEIHQVFEIFQEAYEWSYYDQVLAALSFHELHAKPNSGKSFQAMFCIDDRECSLRRHLEGEDPECETFGTPGFFGVEFYYQPEHGKFHTKLCPAPVSPKYLIKEIDSGTKRKKDAHLSKHTHGLFRGWLISQTLGFWSAFKLFLHIFKPTMSPATASSFKHMDKYSKLTIENTHTDHKEHGLQIGFTLEEMTTRVEALLKSIGLTDQFAPIVYVIGHGSSSVNNPHFAAYDCGACSGRPGSVNARVLCYMANHPEVRKRLKEKGITIPEETQFVGGLHDTTRDEVEFFDEDQLSNINKELHRKNEKAFEKALDLNAKERSRRFELVKTSEKPENVHHKVKLRSVSLFEPRPELNHATNALCIVGRRELSKGIFFDRRSFMNSFDHKIDPEGKYLLNILKAAAPVCGGINLEYFFSRVDNQKLGAGSKLPHNVMGLFGVANGIDGDLRPGLPSQMIEVHDPVRLMIIVEHEPDVVLKTIQANAETYEWFINEWVHLVAIHPDNKKICYFRNGLFEEYRPIAEKVDHVNNIMPVIESTQENLPVVLMD